MPRKRPPRIPKYRLHKSSGCAVVRLNGRDVYLGKHGSDSSRTKYEQVIARWLANGRKLPEARGAAPHHNDDQTMCDLMVAFLEHAQTYYTKNGKLTGEYNNIKDALRPLARLYTHEPIASFGIEALKVVREDMVAAGLCRNVINARINRIRRMFRWGVEENLVGAVQLQELKAVAPLKKGRCTARETPEVTPVPDEWVNAVIKHVPKQIAAMIELQRLTGMRPGEVTSMRGQDIDTRPQTWVYTPTSHKTEHHGRERRIPLGPKARRILIPFLERRPAGYLFSPREVMEDLRNAARKNAGRSKRKESPSKSPGERYTSGSYAVAVARGCQKAFPPRKELSEKDKEAWRRRHSWGPNRLRHNAATLIRKEAGLDAARAVLSHSSLKVTEVYAELDKKLAEQVMEKLG